MQFYGHPLQTEVLLVTDRYYYIPQSMRQFSPERVWPVWHVWQLVVLLQIMQFGI